MTTELTKIINDSQLQATQSERILEAFTKHFEEAKEWEAKARTLNVTSIDQVEDMKEARKARLAMKNIRVDADKTRKQLKEASQREGNAIQGMFNVIKALIVPIEEHLQAQEDFAKNQKAMKIESLRSERVHKLRDFVEDVSLYNITGEEDEETFNNLLNSLKNAHDLQVAAEKKAEEDRLAVEKKAEEDRLRRERDLAEENKRLKAEADKNKALEDERLAALKKEADLKAAEAAKEKADLEKQLKKEEVDRKKLEDERLARLQEEAEAKRLEEEAKIKAEQAPDREKLHALADDIAKLHLPSVKSDKATKTIVDIRESLNTIYTQLKKF